MLVWLNFQLEFGDEKQFYQQAVLGIHFYQQPLWYYGPLAPLLCWPLTLITSNVQLLRILPMCMSTSSLLLCYLICKREVGGLAVLFAVPVFATARLWAGTMWFYWDTFLMSFFLLTLYLSGSKFKYVTAVLLVNAKLFFGTVFLIPLALKNKKILWCLVLFIPWYLVVWVMSGDGLFFLHYLAAIPGSVMVYHNSIWWLEHFSKDFVLFLVLTAPCIALIKKYPTQTSFYLLTIAYSIGAGFGMSHTSTIVFSGALVFPLIAKEVLQLLSKEGKTSWIINPGH